MTNIKVVIGANFGDEGKGLMTDYFCDKAAFNNENCLVVCSNGGSQRGHTVTTPDGLRHIFRHFGSGTFAGADTYFPEQFIVNPIFFRQEYEELESIGYKKPLLHIHPNCLFTTPFDMIINQIVEESRGDNRHGSCGMGIWETIVRNGMTVKDFNDLSVKNQIDYLYDIRNNYLPMRLRDLGITNIKDEWLKIISSDNLIINYVNDFNWMTFKIEDVFTDDIILKQYENIVFENGQGLLLDQNIQGYGKHTTPSNTGIKNPITIIKSVFEKNEYDLEICYVTRSYMTRHGAGRFDTECSMEEINPYIIDPTNIPNLHQGSIRYGKLNLIDLKKRIKNDCKDIKACISLAVTHLNEYSINIQDIMLDFDRIYGSNGCDRNSVLLKSNLRRDIK